MNFVEWSKSSVDYGRRLMNSGMEGARAAEDEFLKEEPRAPFLNEWARRALAPAAIGACVGALGAYLGNRRSARQALFGGLLGGAIGLGAGVIWESRGFAARVASGAWKNMAKTRDEHWLERHPIDYA